MDTTSSEEEKVGEGSAVKYQIMYLNRKVNRGGGTFLIALYTSQAVIHAIDIGQ
jgi:aspartyl aminopeptidase